MQKRGQASETVAGIPTTSLRQECLGDTPENRSNWGKCEQAKKVQTGRQTGSFEPIHRRQEKECLNGTRSLKEDSEAESAKGGGETRRGGGGTGSPSVKGESSLKSKL